MKLDKTMQILHTSVGSIFSIILFIIVGAYALQQTEIMITRKENIVMASTMVNFYDPDYVFDFDQGLNFAVGIIDPFDPLTLKPVDPTFGRIKVTKSSWGVGEDGALFFSSPEIETHLCSSDELGQPGTNHKIWPINKSQQYAFFSL